MSDTTPKYKLWEALHASETYTKSYEEFEKQFSTQGAIDKLYSTLSGAEYYTKSKDDFYGQYFSDLGKQPASPSGNGGASSSGQSQQPAQPSTPSGSGFKPFRGGLATEEEARPKVGKNAPEMIKQEEIVVQEPLTDEQKREITLDFSKRLATFPTSRQEAEASFEKEQQEKRDLARQERLNKGRAYQAYTGNPNVDVATLEVQYQEALDKDKREMETAKKMGIEYTPSIQPIEIKNKIEDTYKVIESDYLRYLQATDPDRYSQYTDRISTIEGKEKPSLEDQKFLTQLRAEAVDVKTAASEAKIADIKAGTDLAKFSRVQPLIAEESRKLQGELEALVNPDGTPKSPESVKKIELLQQQAQGLQDRYNQLVEETGVTDEVVQQLNNSYDWLTGGEVLESGWQRFPELKSAERLQLEEQAIRKDIAENGGMLSKSALMVMSFMDSVGSGVVSMAQAPKVLADSLGYGKENGWTDVLYDLSTDINTRAAGRTAPLDSENNILDVIDIFSKGAGSVVQFAAGGSLGGATKAGQFAATTATAFLMTEGDAYREALAAGISSEDAAQYATMIALAQGMTESVIPDIKYFDPAARASILAAIKNKTGVKQAFKEYAETIVKDVPKVGLKEGGEEIVTEVTGDVIKEGINAIRDQKIYQDTFDGKSYLETFLSGFVTGGGMQMLKRGNKNLTPTEETVPRAIGENADAVLETIAYASPDNAVEAAETVGGLREIVMGLQGIPSYQNLGAREKDFVVNSMARKAELEKSMKEAGMKDEATVKEIEKIESDVNAVYAGKKVGEEYEVEVSKDEKVTNIVGNEARPEETTQSVPPVAENATASVGEVKAPDASIEEKKADIEKRRQEELNKDENVELLYPLIIEEFPSVEDLERASKNEKDKNQRQQNRDRINAKYDAELAALEAAPISTQTGIEGVVVEEVTPEGVQVEEKLGKPNNLQEDVGSQGVTLQEVEESKPEVKEVVTQEVNALKDVESTAKAFVEQGIPNEVVKEGFTESKDLNEVFAATKAKYGEKEGSKYNDVVNRLVNPNKNTIIEVRSNGVVVKENGKYIFKPFTNTDANYKKWELGRPMDITEQYAPALSQAYHTAKADGSNPELVQAVESLLGQPQQAVAEETKPSVFDAIEAAERSKKTVKGKQEAAKEVAKEYGELGEKAIFVNENFKEIVESLKELRDEKGNKVLTVKC